MKDVDLKMFNNILNSFALRGISVEKYGFGHINDTFLVKTQNTRYILQKINKTVFLNPKELMQNIVGVTEHLIKIIKENGGDSNRESLNVIKTLENKNFLCDTNGDYWRVYLFIEDTVCLQKPEKPENMYESGKAFGTFQKLLSTYSAKTLNETIKQFHDTKNRLENFKDAIKKDSFNRAKDIQNEIGFILEREEECSVLINLQKSGKIPLRVTHNDTKLNNILFDKKTMKAICVIDLDTVMPGLCAYDFGDTIRFSANNCQEDEKDLSKVNFSLELYELFTKGFMESAGETLTETEIQYLAFGAKIMTLESAIRFLTDYLEGDFYFKINEPLHNLYRGRTQLKLLSDMEENFNDMNKIVKQFS